MIILPKIVDSIDLELHGASSRTAARPNHRTCLHVPAADAACRFARLLWHSLRRNGRGTRLSSLADLSGFEQTRERGLREADWTSPEIGAPMPLEQAAEEVAKKGALLGSVRLCEAACL